jgi:hypothetical protein
MKKEIFYDFYIPGFSTQREWSVYIAVLIHVDPKIKEKKIYVGKVGDNSNGCNPIITRIGNHLSLYADHSQLRNKISDTTDYNYHVYFATFGLYTGKNKDKLDKVNQLERELNVLIQSKIKNKLDYVMLNPFFGKYYIKPAEREKRRKLLTGNDKAILEKLADNAMNENRKHSQ